MLCTSHGPSRSAAPLLLKRSEMRTAKRPTERYGFGARALPKAYEDSGYGRVLSGPEADSRSRLVLERTGPEADVAGAGPVPAQTWCTWAQSPAQSRRRCGRGGPSRSAGLAHRSRKCRSSSRSMRTPTDGAGRKRKGTATPVRKYSWVVPASCSISRPVPVRLWVARCRCGCGWPGASCSCGWPGASCSCGWPGASCSTSKVARCRCSYGWPGAGAAVGGEGRAQSRCRCGAVGWEGRAQSRFSCGRASAPCGSAETRCPCRSLRRRTGLDCR